MRATYTQATTVLSGNIEMVNLERDKGLHQHHLCLPEIKSNLKMGNGRDERACKEPTRVEEADNRMWLDMLVSMGQKRSLNGKRG